MTEVIGLVASCETLSSVIFSMSAFLIDFKGAPKSAKELSGTLDRKIRVLDNLLTNIRSMDSSPDDLRLIRDTLDSLEVSLRCLYTLIAPLIQCNWSREKIMKIKFTDLSHAFKGFMKKSIARCRWAASSSVRRENMEEIKGGLDDLMIMHNCLDYRQTERRNNLANTNTQQTERRNKNIKKGTAIGGFVGATTGGCAGIVSEVWTGVQCGMVTGGAVGAVVGGVVGVFVGAFAAWYWFGECEKD